MVSGSVRVRELGVPRKRAVLGWVLAAVVVGVLTECPWPICPWPLCPWPIHQLRWPSEAWLHLLEQRGPWRWPWNRWVCHSFTRQACGAPSWAGCLLPLLFAWVPRGQHCDRPPSRFRCMAETSLLAWGLRPVRDSLPRDHGEAREPWFPSLQPPVC